MHSNKSLVRLSIVLALIVTVIGLLALDRQPTSASPLRQIIPTNTPAPPPTSTPVPPPTSTPAPPPTSTPIPPPTSTPGAPPPTSTPGAPPPTSTPGGLPTNTPATGVPPAPRRGGGGGAPAGPSSTPTVNGCVLSVGKDGVSLSTEAGFYKAHVQTAPRGDILRVLQGPERVDTIWWWRLRTATGVEGWGNQDNITPDPGPCSFGVTTTATGQTAPAAQAGTPAGALPKAGSDGLEWVFLAGVLGAVLIVAATWRRILQAQPAGNVRLPDDEDDPHSQA